MPETVLRVENLSKKFCRTLKRSLWYGVRDLAGELAFRKGSRQELRKEEFWALKDISFELHKGETLGLIGYNGAGKSTLLRLINGLIRPDCGRIDVWGQIGALIALGTGFNPILTGRENIYVNAAILGFSKQEIDRRLEEIIEFAEIGEFIDAPLRSYSSGMRIRLGFSVASNLDPDLLLIDEVLSVGDSAFRQRCVDRLTSYRQRGGTIIFVSHNSLAVEKISDRVMLLNRGRVEALGDPADVVRQYEQQALEISRRSAARMGTEDKRPTDVLDVHSTALVDSEGKATKTIPFGGDIELVVDYEIPLAEEIETYPLIHLYPEDGTAAGPFGSITPLWEGLPACSEPGRHEFRCRIKSPPITPGNYCLHLGFINEATSHTGSKWSYPPRPVLWFTVDSAQALRQWPTAPGKHLVSRIPPMVLSPRWIFDGVEMGPDPQEATKGSSGDDVP